MLVEDGGASHRRGAGLVSGGRGRGDSAAVLERPQQASEDLSLGLI